MRSGGEPTLESISGGSAEAAEPGPDRGLLITGTPRSGTTWVGRMLALDPRLFYAHEPFNNRFRRRMPHLLGAPVRPYFRHVPVGGEYVTVSRFLDFLMGRSDELAEIDRSDWSEEEKGLFQQIREDRDRGSMPVVKDPISVLAMEWIRMRYDVPVIVMVRHPAEFARSMLRLGWDTGPRKFLAQPEFSETLPREIVIEIEALKRPREEPIRSAALMWKVVNLHVHQVAQRHPGWIRVFRHEDLAGDPMGGFGDITEWLNMTGNGLLERIEPYCSEDNPSEPEHHWVIQRNSRASMDRWRSYFEPSEQREIRDIVHPVSELYGYSF